MIKIEMPEIQLALLLKHRALKRIYGFHITFEDLQLVIQSVWEKRFPKSISFAVDEIMNLTGEQFIELYTTCVIKQLPQVSFDDFKDLIQE